MVKKTKLRPRRLFYDSDRKKYYYLINGVKKFIKTGDISQKQLVKINIKNIVPVKTEVRKRRQPAETTLITSSKKVAPTLLAPISANLTPNLNLYKLKDNEKLAERFSGLEKKIELLADTSKAKIPKPTIGIPPSPTPATPVPEPPSPIGPPPLVSSSSTPAPSTTKKVKMNKNVAEKLINRFIKEGGKSYIDFQDWFYNNSDEYIDGLSFGRYTITQDFSQLFKTKYKEYISRPEYSLATSFLNNPPEPKKPEPKPEEKKPNIMTMSDLNKDKERAKTYAEAFKQGLSNIANALSPKSSKVAPQATKGSTTTLTTTEDDNPVDKGDINVPAGVPSPEDDENIPITLKKKETGKGKYEDDKNGIYNDELEQIFYDKLHKFVPVISSDEMWMIEKMVNKETKKIGWIQNTEPSSSGGRHWVAYFINIPEKEINYYDSLVENNGMPPPESMKGLKKIIDKINPEYYLKFKNNLCRYQNPKSNNCGYFSLKFILDRYNNIPFTECTGYDRVKNEYGEGEKMIKKFKKYL